MGEHLETWLGDDDIDLEMSVIKRFGQRERVGDLTGKPLVAVVTFISKLPRNGVCHSNRVRC